MWRTRDQDLCIQHAKKATDAIISSHLFSIETRLQFLVLSQNKGQYCESNDNTRCIGIPETQIIPWYTNKMNAHFTSGHIHYANANRRLQKRHEALLKLLLLLLHLLVQQCTHIYHTFFHQVIIKQCTKAGWVT